MDDIYKAYLGRYSGLNQMLESQRRFQEDLLTLAAPYLELRKTMENWLLPYRLFQEEIQKWAEPYRAMQDQIRKWIEPQQKLQEQMQRLVEPYRQLQEQMRTFVEPYQQWQKEMQRLLSTSTTLKDYATEVARLRYSVPELEAGINRLLNNVDEHSISVDEAGAITVGSETASGEEFSAMFSVFLETLGNLPSPAEAIAFIWEYAGKLRRSLAIILLMLVLPYVINVTSNLTTPYIEDLVGKIANRPRREQIKFIKAEAAKQLDISLLREYRFVSAEVLHIRSEKSTKAMILADIKFGQVVRVIRKGRDWSYVECVARDAELSVEGWVFSRYLRRFKE